jgi:hypothetical protein
VVGPMSSGLVPSSSLEPAAGKGQGQNRWASLAEFVHALGDAHINCLDAQTFAKRSERLKDYG